jgi:ribonucleoside-diphosphate reductase alpha chain
MYNYYLYKSTIMLGKEKGSFGLFNKEKIEKSQFIKNMMTNFPDLDFSAMRNVTVSSIAPTGTLSLMSKYLVMSYGLSLPL